jgi:hypothetical protein
VFSITYVSQNLIDPPNRARVLADIMVDAVSRNTELGITDLLIVSPDHFAQKAPVGRFRSCLYHLRICNGLFYTVP